MKVKDKNTSGEEHKRDRETNGRTELSYNVQKKQERCLGKDGQGD